jgi:hypothetical protein
MTATRIAKPTIATINKEAMLARTRESGDEDSQNRLFIRNAEHKSNKEAIGD